MFLGRNLNLTSTLVLALTFGFVYAFSTFGFFSLEIVSLYDDLLICFEIVSLSSDLWISTISSLCTCLPSDFF